MKYFLWIHGISGCARNLLRCAVLKHSPISMIGLVFSAPCALHHISLAHLFRASLILIVTISLPACISTPEVKNREVSPAQNYQFEGDDQSTKITGLLEKYGNDWAYHGAFLTVQIGSEKVITRKPVDTYNFSGKIGGSTYRDKKVSASCVGYAVTDRWTDVRCTVFVGNEQTVTLVF